MANTIPFPGAAQAARDRKAKTRLLPMPRATADRLALEVHLALDILRRGQGRACDAQSLLQTMILAGLLAEQGHGHLELPAYREADFIICECFDRGRVTTEWSFDEGGFRAFARIVTLYDGQLCRAPLAALAKASEQLDRLQAREKLDELVRKSA
jgi:hypothetical protein